MIDVIEGNGNLLVYIADVSGHGLAAGQLMGMLKTAMRVSLQFRQTPTALLESADRVLPAVKELDMYATLALLQFDGSAQAEYALAGHVPILHYRDHSRDTARLSMEQFPLGLIPGGCYQFEMTGLVSPNKKILVKDRRVPAGVSVEAGRGVTKDTQKATKGKVSLEGLKSRERETSSSWEYLNYKRQKYGERTRYRRKRLTTRPAGEPQVSGCEDQNSLPSENDIK